MNFRLHKNRNYLLPLLTGCISALILQSIWVYSAYQMKYKLIAVEAKEAFDLAYQKEQTYRIPVVDIINPGEVTIQSCGNEEITIVRKCYDSDTLIYNNASGHSIEHFLNRVFWDLRENMVPMNIYCLADLFAGMLHDINLSASFTIERYNINTGNIIESSLISGEKQTRKKSDMVITTKISEDEAVRAILYMNPGIVLGSIGKILVFTILLMLIVIFCLAFLCRCNRSEKDTLIDQTPDKLEKHHENIFSIGEFHFDFDKNELRGFGETIQLNKKENAILHSLCVQNGNIVERNVLLEENWGSSGIIYSRSLDTYLTTLRKYLKKDPSIQIVTVKGVGYKLVISK